MTQSFTALGLPSVLVETVTALGYSAPTPIQSKAIPELLAGKDVLAAAQTGTGKTAAFALPLITHLLNQPQSRRPKSVRALILAPTRELAAQIDENIRAYCAKTLFKTALIFGGVNIRPQIEALSKGVDFLVATPGRLLDHAGQKTVDLSQVEYLVLDEADRMLDMGFIHDIKKVLALIPKKRQTLLFSATFSDDIRRLAQSLLVDPVSVEVARNKENTLITQEAWRIAKKRKRELLRDLIVDNAWDQVLVFTRMKHTANRLASQLEKDGIIAAAIHGNKSQSARTKALSGFKDKSVRVLVATDIAARGLDIEGLPHVINYELPNVPEDYVHRIGRTGRAGVPGHAVSLVCPDEADYLRAIERLLKHKIPTQKAQGYDGEVPEDIAKDEAERDRARALELQRLRESRRQARNKTKPARPTAVSHQNTTVETSRNPEDRFEKKIRRDEASRAKNVMSETRRPRAQKRNTMTRTEAQDAVFVPRTRRPHQNEARDTRPSRDSREDSRRHSLSRTTESRRDVISNVSTVSASERQRQRRRDDARFESVSSNLPPGMVLKYRRR